MKAVADQLERFDKYLGEKSESERWILIVLIAAIVGYLLYITVQPYAEDLYRQTVVQKEQLKKKIAEEKQYLKSITVNGDRDYYVKLFDRQIKEKNGKIESYKNRISLLNENFQKLSEILFNQKSWSKFLESLSSRANFNNISLRELTNEYVDQNASFGHVLEIGIRCRGSFGDLLSFINDIEQSKLVTDVFNSDLVSKAGSNKVDADINISVWGVNH